MIKNDVENKYGLFLAALHISWRKVMKYYDFKWNHNIAYVFIEKYAAKEPKIDP